MGFINQLTTWGPHPVANFGISRTDFELISPWKKVGHFTNMGTLAVKMWILPLNIGISAVNMMIRIVQTWDLTKLGIGKS